MLIIIKSCCVDLSQETLRSFSRLIDALENITGYSNPFYDPIEPLVLATFI